MVMDLIKLALNSMFADVVLFIFFCLFLSPNFAPSYTLSNLALE